MKFTLDSPVGVFDSGVGGLSVLQHIRQTLPFEQLLYVADSAFAPYGEKTEAAIIERCLAITDFLLSRHIKALVVACNTATAAAIRVLRATYPELMIIGMEPGLKPATQLSKKKIVGVLATERTLNSQKFCHLRNQLQQETQTQFIEQACNGLAEQIEKGELQSDATRALLHRYLSPLATAGADVIVLGCTHYPFVKSAIEPIWDKLSPEHNNIEILDTGRAVSLYLRERLLQTKLISTAQKNHVVQAYTSACPEHLARALTQLLQLKNEEFSVSAIPQDYCLPARYSFPNPCTME